MATEMNFFSEEESETLLSAAAVDLDTEPLQSDTNSSRDTADRLLRALKITLVILLLAAGGIGIVYFVQIRGKDNAPPPAPPAAQSIPAASAAPAPTPTPTPTPTPVPIPRDEWYLRLVNAENPLPEDFDVDTTAVDPAGYYLDARAADDYAAMLAASIEDGMQLKIASAYRSFDRQEQLFLAKVREYTARLPKAEAEAAAAKEVARPGESEHNLGLALDIVATYNQRMGDDYKNTPECQWLAAHAWEYGFILRYPEAKQEITGVIYEPWHYRYVGKEQAKHIYESGLCLEEYLA